MRQRIICRLLFLASSPFHLSHPSLSEQGRTANWMPLSLTSLPFCLLLCSSSPSCSMLCRGTQMLQWVNSCTGKALMGNNCNLQMPVNIPRPIGGCSASKKGNGKHRNMCTCRSADRHLIFFFWEHHVLALRAWLRERTGQAVLRLLLNKDCACWT